MHTVRLFDSLNRIQKMDFNFIASPRDLPTLFAVFYVESSKEPFVIEKIYIFSLMVHSLKETPDYLEPSTR